MVKSVIIRGSSSCIVFSHSFAHCIMSDVPWSQAIGCGFAAQLKCCGLFAYSYWECPFKLFPVGNIRIWTMYFFTPVARRPFFSVCRTSESQLRCFARQNSAPKRIQFSVAWGRPLQASGISTSPAIAKNSWVEHVPVKIRPYLYLTRIDKPIGTLLLFYPCGECTCILLAEGSDNGQ